MRGIDSHCSISSVFAWGNVVTEITLKSKAQSKTGGSSIFNDLNVLRSKDNSSETVRPY